MSETAARVEVLKEIVGKAQDEIGRVESAERIEKNKVHVGKFFLRHNTANDHASSGNKMLRWTSYAVCTRIDEHGLLFVNSVDLQPRGYATVCVDECAYHMQYWEPCTAKEYQAGLKKFDAHIAKVLG